jgi:hypothetical protein
VEGGRRGDVRATARSSCTRMAMQAYARAHIHTHILPVAGGAVPAAQSGAGGAVRGGVLGPQVGRLLHQHDASLPHRVCCADTHLHRGRSLKLTYTHKPTRIRTHMQGHRAQSAGAGAVWGVRDPLPHIRRAALRGPPAQAQGTQSRLVCVLLCAGRWIDRTRVGPRCGAAATAGFQR